MAELHRTFIREAKASPTLFWSTNYSGRGDFSLLARSRFGEGRSPLLEDWRSTSSVLSLDQLGYKRLDRFIYETDDTS